MCLQQPVLLPALPSRSGDPLAGQGCGGSVDRHLLPGLGCRRGVGGCMEGLFLESGFILPQMVVILPPVLQCCRSVLQGSWSPNPGSQISAPHPSSPSFVFVLSQTFNAREEGKAFSLPFVASPGELLMPFVPPGLKMGKWEPWEKGRPPMRGETT